MDARDAQAGVTRRLLLRALGLAGAALAFPQRLLADEAGKAHPDAFDAPMGEILELTEGVTPELSERLQLVMPRVFANGYTVPLAIAVDSPMTDADHVGAVHVLAPGNPFLKVATFRFFPGRSRPKVSTRIRLAQPQHIYALAAMSDGSFLLARTWVEVKTNGCAS